VEPIWPEDEKTLLRSVQGDPFWEPMLVLALDTGARQGELLGLDWKYLDLESRLISIRQSLDTIAGIPVLKSGAKTIGSIREIDLARATARVLARMRNRTNSVSGLLFVDECGRPFTRTKFYYRWRTMLARAGVRHYHFHSTRHSCAYRLLRAGEYITAVSRRLGHSKPSVTLDIYSAFMPTDGRRLADRFDLQLGALVCPGDLHKGSQIGSCEDEDAA
jgi:integrase